MQRRRARGIQIADSVWLEKEIVRKRLAQNKRTLCRSPYTRVKRAFSAVGTKVFDDGEDLINVTFDSMLADEQRASTAADQLKKECDDASKLFSDVSGIDGSKTARTKLGAISSDTSDILHFLQEQNPAQAKLLEDAILAKLEARLLQASIVPPKAKGGITATMERLLASYHDLDDDTKKSLLNNAISTNNEELQHRLLTLRQASGSTLAKLTKELIKMADSYKVPELNFDEKAVKRRLNFQGWILKLRPILMMFQ
jgi:hypothetical protein